MRLVAPMSLGILAHMTTGLVDAFWLGRLNPEEPVELAAVSFAFPVTMAVFSVAIGLGAGTASVVARAAGAGDRARVRRLTTDAMMLSMVVVAVVSLAGVVLIDPVFRLMGASDALMPHIRVFMRIWFVSVLFVVGPMLASNVLRALGDAISPSVIMISVAFTNLVLDPFLIFGIGPFPALGVAGAALATLVANALAFIAAGYLVAVRERLITTHAPPRQELMQSWGEIARIGLPASVSNMINPVAMAFVYASVARFGEEAVAGFGAAARVEMIAVIPLFALSASIGPVTGQNSGAGHMDRVREAFVESFRMAALWGLAVAAVLALSRGGVAAAFTENAAAREAIRAYLLALPVTTMGYGIIICMAAGFNGLGKPLPGVAASFARGMVLLAPLAWIGGALGGLWGTLLGMGAANLVAGAAATAWTLRVAFPPPLAAVVAGAPERLADGPEPPAAPPS